MSDTSPVRPGEVFDKDRLIDFLLPTGLIVDSNIVIEQFPAGSSNLTYLVTTGSEDLVLRRPPFGNIVRSAHDMRREFNVLSKLSAVYSPAPKPIMFCDDESVIGSEFYLMERRKGLIVRGRAPDVLERSPDLQKQVCRSFIDNLSLLHSLDYSAAGLGELGHPKGYPHRQVEGWTKRYLAAKTDDWHELESAIRWLNENIPEESGAALVHNDYKFDNIMLDPNDLTKIVAVLDWEMVTIGDPLMDLGTTLAYWMSRNAGRRMLDMPFNPRVLMENVSRRELAEMYSEASGRDVSKILYYYVFGTFKIAVIAQQIYARFAKGFTKDARFAKFDLFVETLGRFAEQSIQTQAI